MNTIFNKFTSHLRNVLAEAITSASQFKHDLVEPEHLLYGLILEKGSVGQEVVNRSLSAEKLRLILTNKFPTETPRDRSLPADKKISEKTISPALSVASKKLLEQAALASSLHHHKYIGTEHLLLAMLQSQNHNLNKIFLENNLETKQLEKQIKSILRSAYKFPDLTSNFIPADDLAEFEHENDLVGLPKTKTKTPTLDFFALDLTSPKIQKNIDPVIGREEEIDRLIQILCRRTKNNPLLLGDPGVGKTVIVEGLAKRILLGQVPEILLDKRILSLDLSLVVAGTMFRGEFESRLKQIVEEIKQNPNLIIFIDEIHNIVGAGSASGSIDAANILKPGLARGEIRCIGATTYEEYKKHLESDLALERRFQPIFIGEPTVAKTIEILEGIKNNYEKFHGVRITQAAIKAAAELSARYLPDRFLPDKAIDLIDEAAAEIKIRRRNNGHSLEIKKLETELANLKNRKQRAVIKENFNEAIDHQKKEQELTAKLLELKKINYQDPTEFLGQITEKDIARILARIIGLPLEEIVSTEKEKLLNLEKVLAEKIVGQTEAIKLVAEAIRRSRTKISSAEKPIASLLFLGPSGVGKTELAKVLATTLFRDKESFIRIDLSEFSESFNISKLIGAPAGYVGYKESGKLTEAVKRRPHSVVLLDEIEKAHPDVFSLFLQILDDGQLTDATGKKINFLNTIIILTSNIGTQLWKQNQLGFENKNSKGDHQTDYTSIRNQILKELEKYFKAEFLNRLDQIIIFNPLNLKNIKEIVRLQLTELNKRLASQNLAVELTPEAIDFITNHHSDPAEGARGIRRTIQDLIENRLAEDLLKNKFQKDDIIKIGLANRNLIFKVK